MNQIDALRFALSTINENADAYEVIESMIATREKAAARPKAPSKTTLRNAELIRDVVVPFVNAHTIVTAKQVANECGNAEVATSPKAAALLGRAANEGLIVSFKETKASATLYAALDYDVDAHIERVNAERMEKARERAEKAAAKAAAKAQAAQERVDALTA